MKKMLSTIVVFLMIISCGKREPSYPIYTRDEKKLMYKEAKDNENQEKLKEIENMKKTGGRNMEKTIQELINEHPKLMNDYKNQIINEIGNSEKEKIEAAIKAERERIQALDKIPTLNDSQKETINKAKFEEPREPKDIMAEFFVSNANKANQEIQAAKDDILKAGLDKIIPSNSDLGDNSVEDEIYKAALNAYNDEEK